MISQLYTDQITKNERVTFEHLDRFPHAGNLVRTDVRAMFDAWRPIPAKLDTVTAQIDAVAHDSRLDGRAKRTQESELRWSAQESIEPALAAMEQRAAVIDERLAAAGNLQRPEPVDALQVAELARLQAGWQMVLAPISTTALPDRLVQFAVAAAAGGDQLAVWALAVDSWPALYLESRSGDTYARSSNGSEDHATIHQTVIAAFRDFLPAAAREAHELRQALFSGNEGIEVTVLTARTYVSKSLGA